MRKKEPTSLVVAVGENEEKILEDRKVELAEKDTRRLEVSLGHVIHQLQTHSETRVLDLSVVMFGCPHATVNDGLELDGVDLQQCLETVQVDRLQKLEELNTMLRIFVEVLVDHRHCAIENTFHDARNLVFHEVLQTKRKKTAGQRETHAIKEIGDDSYIRGVYG